VEAVEAPGAWPGRSTPAGRPAFGCIGSARWIARASQLAGGRRRAREDCPHASATHAPPGALPAGPAPANACPRRSVAELAACRSPLCERVGNRLVSAQAGQWCHKAAGVDHATDFGPEGATTLQLVLPARAALSAGLPWHWGSDASVTGLLWTLLGGGLAAVEPEILHDLAALLEPCCEDARSPPWWPRAHEAFARAWRPSACWRPTAACTARSWCG
jgi:hypothetical protein